MKYYMETEHDQRLLNTILSRVYGREAWDAIQAGNWDLVMIVPNRYPDRKGENDGEK